MGCHALLPGILPTQGLILHLLQLLPGRRILYHWATREAPSLSHIHWIHFTPVSCSFPSAFFPSLLFSFLSSLLCSFHVLLFSPYYALSDWITHTHTHTHACFKCLDKVMNKALSGAYIVQETPTCGRALFLECIRKPSKVSLGN